jgi:choline dehydrogenase-like flavoprotein
MQVALGASSLTLKSITQMWPGLCSISSAITPKTLHYCAGSCRMGSGADVWLDLRLHFNGIAALRVVDASITPRVNS